MRLLIDTGRRELKYFISPELIGEVKSFVSPYVEVDPYASHREDNTYTIRSIYFDTQQWDFYYDKLDGLEIRKKIRVRTYNEFLPDGSAFLEIKRKYSNQIVKERTRIPLKQIDQICLHKEDPNGHDKRLSFDYDAAVIRKFLYNLNALNLEPSLLVTYEREAYVCAADSSMRLTFDKDVRASISPALEDLFREDGFSFVTNGRCILELKFNGFMPKWMRSLVAELDFRAQPISKYCLGIDTCRGDDLLIRKE